MTTGELISLRQKQLLIADEELTKLLEGVEPSICNLINKPVAGMTIEEKLELATTVQGLLKITP